MSAADMSADHSVSKAVRNAIGALVAVVALLALAPIALANTYTPTRLGDPTPNGCKPNDCSLREAVTKANHHSGPDKIVIQGGKTYDLTAPNSAGDEDANATGDLDVLGGLTIASSNHKQATVDANGIDRVFEVGPSSPVSATFQRVTIRGGKGDSSEHGGGIDSEHGGTLKLIDSKVIGNTTADEGGGIAADGGSLNLVRSVIARNSATGPSKNAGGIEGEPGSTENEVISISRSRIVNNHAAGGAGGIYGYNKLTINRSTLSGNTAGQDGAAIYNGSGTATVKNSTLNGNVAGDDGGALDNLGTATLINDTFANNKAAGDGGGIANEGGTINMNAVTVARNRSDSDSLSGGAGGGLFFLSPIAFNVKNSLVAKNSAGPSTGPDCYNSGTPFASGGHNLIGDSLACTDFTATGDRIDLSNSKIGIGSLANNGGPTKTIGLLSGSKAINHAGSNAPSRDQRGHKRHDPDIGAFEKN
jgi:hypothetical protein